MKRILTTTILLGRKGKKDSVHSLSTKGQHEFDENGSDYYEKEGLIDIEHSGIRIGEGMEKCKNGKGGKMKSSKQRYDENMDTENISNKHEVTVCLTKRNNSGKKLKEMCIEISQDQTSATTEIVIKPRKRKERLDSEGSVKQENKVIRSSSEERAEVSDGKEQSMRRVSSHEDFSRTRVLQEINPTQTSTTSNKLEKNDCKESDFNKNEFRMEEMFLNAEELEHERIRSCERFSRTVAPPRGRRNLAKKRTKTSKKKNESAEQSNAKMNMPKESLLPLNDSVLEVAERDRSPSPGVSSSPPALDFTALHKQMEGSEPITSRGKVVSPEVRVSTSIFHCFLF